MFIFLDDERVPSDVKWVSLPNVDWTIVRSYNQFRSLVESLTEAPKFIAFDHDLADNRPQEKTGYDCAKWLVEVCINAEWKIPDYVVHSFNPIGKKNIEAYLENAKEHL